MLNVQKNYVSKLTKTAKTTIVLKTHLNGTKVINTT